MSKENIEKLAKAYIPKAYEDAVYKKWEHSGAFNSDNFPFNSSKPLTSSLSCSFNLLSLINFSSKVIWSFFAFITSLIALSCSLNEPFVPFNASLKSLLLIEADIIALFLSSIVEFTFFKTASKP